MNGAGRTPYPQRKLGPGLIALLWLLRLYVVLAVPLVVYAFIKALQHTPM